jgi:hypothetical protein
MACLGSVTWDYFDNPEEAQDWTIKLKRMGVDSKYLGEKNGRFVVQKIEESPFKVMEKIPPKRNLF